MASCMSVVHSPCTNDIYCSPSRHVPNRHLLSRHVVSRHLPSRHPPTHHLPNRHPPQSSHPKSSPRYKCHSCKDARDIYNGPHIMHRHNPASVHTLHPCSLPSIMQRSGQSCSGAFKKRRRAPKARVREIGRASCRERVLDGV